MSEALGDPKQPATRDPAVAEPSGGAYSSKAPVEIASGAILLAVFAAIGAAVGWWAIQRYYPAFEPPQALQEKIAKNTQAVFTAEEAEQLRAVGYRNAGFAVAMLGLFVGSLIGIAEGAARRSVLIVLVGAVAGAILGCGLGMLGGMTGHHLYDTALRGQAPLTPMKVILIHVATFGITGFGIGLGISLSSFNISLMIRCALRAAMGGACAGLLYLPFMAVILPAANTDRTLPDGSGNRLVWACIFAVLVALVLGSVKSRATAQVPSPATT